MAFRKEVKKAKEYVREEMSSISSSDLSLEESIALAKTEFDKIIEEEELDIAKEEVVFPVIGQKPALQRRLINLYLSGNYTVRQMAQIIGVAHSTICKWLREPQIREAIEKYQQEEDMIVNASLKALRMKAIQKASELLDADNEMVQSIMVRDVLDRTGHKAVEKKEVTHNITYEQRIQMLLNGDEDKTVENVEYTIDGETPDGKINTERDDK
jgi:transposase-like protein